MGVVFLSTTHPAESNYYFPLALAIHYYYPHSLQGISPLTSDVFTARHYPYYIINRQLSDSLNYKPIVSTCNSGYDSQAYGWSRQQDSSKSSQIWNRLGLFWCSTGKDTLKINLQDKFKRLKSQKSSEVLLKKKKKDETFNNLPGNASYDNQKVIFNINANIVNLYHSFPGSWNR